MSFTHPSLVLRLKAADVWRIKPKNWTPDWYHTLVPNYQEIPSNQLAPGSSFGVQYETISISTDRYLEWLQNEFIKCNGIIQHKELAHIDEAFESDVDTVINCTGLGSATLGGVQDTHVYPTRGQLVIVKKDTLPKWTITRLDDFI